MNICALILKTFLSCEDSLTWKKSTVKTKAHRSGSVTRVVARRATKANQRRTQQGCYCLPQVKRWITKVCQENAWIKGAQRKSMQYRLSFVFSCANFKFHCYFFSWLRLECVNLSARAAFEPSKQTNLHLFCMSHCLLKSRSLPTKTNSNTIVNFISEVKNSSK